MRASADRQNYVAHLREAAAHVGGAGATDTTELLELRIRWESSEDVDPEQAREMWSALMRGLRQFVQGLPDKIAFEELEAAATEDEVAAEKAAATTQVRAFTPRKPARKPFPAHLPRERVVVPGPTQCACCGSKRGPTCTNGAALYAGG